MTEDRRRVELIDMEHADIELEKYSGQGTFEALEFTYKGSQAVLVPTDTLSPEDLAYVIDIIARALPQPAGKGKK